MLERVITVRPTKKQRELLTYIEHFIREHGYSPSYREIMAGLHYTSVATVALHVNNLIKRGHLHKREHSARSLEVVAPQGQHTTASSTGEEKWLVEKVEQIFSGAEKLGAISRADVERLHMLVGALNVLGLENAALAFADRLNTLKSKLWGTTSSVVAGDHEEYAG